MIGEDLAICNKLLKDLKYASLHAVGGHFAWVWRQLCMGVAATWAQLPCNKNLNKKMKTQLKNLKFYTTLVLAYS